MTPISEFHNSLIEKIRPHLSADKIDFLLKTKVIFNKYLRTSIGRAHLHKNLIELNEKLLRTHPQEFYKTFAHEFAHIAAPLIFGKDGLGHGPGWKQTMETLGYAPERTHNLPVKHSRQKPVALGHCGCADRVHEIKSRVFRKMRYGRRTYICLKCQEPLRLSPLRT